MNKYILPLVCAVAAYNLGTFASYGAEQAPGDDAAYQQVDDNSYVQTESDAAGTYDVFYDRLAPEGRWFYDDDYGYVWQPNVAESTTDWRPYADGHWVWTDRGWFWDSNEDFGWATYHYGRWVQVAGAGWIWVPGDQWAPAWVSWRQTDDDDYVGWAPLPPEASFNVSVGFHPWCDSYYDIGPAAFAFIRIGDFCRPSYREFWVPPQQNLVLINRTTNITNITYNNSVVYNYGPQYQRVSQLVQQRAGQQVPNYKINYAAQKQLNAGFKTAVEGNQLSVIAPPQKLRAVATAEPKVAKQLGKAQVERGWQNVPEGQAQQLRHQFAEKAPVPQTLPAKPALPGKPRILAVTKGEQPKGPAKGQEGPNGQLQPFVQKPGNNAAIEQQKAEQQKLEAEKAQKDKGRVEKAQVEENQQKLNAQHAGQPEKKPTREELTKAKKEEVKKGPPAPPQGNASQHAQHAVANQPPQHHTEKAHAQQPAVHQAAPHVVQAPHPQPHVVQAPHPQPHVAQAPHPQPHVAQAPHPQPHQPPHVAAQAPPHPQPHPPAPHVAQAPHPQPHPPAPHVAQAPHPQPRPQPHGAANNNNQKKKNGHQG